MHKDERKVRGFQEWQPTFARSHICTVGNPDTTKHSETYQESVHNTCPTLAMHSLKHWEYSKTYLQCFILRQTAYLNKRINGSSNTYDSSQQIRKTGAIG